MSTAPYTEIIYDVENNDNPLPLTLENNRNYLVEYSGVDPQSRQVETMLIGTFSNIDDISSFQPTNAVIIRNNALIVTPLPPEQPDAVSDARFHTFGTNIKKIYQIPAPAPALLPQGGYKRKSKKVRKRRKGKKGKKTKKYSQKKIEL